MKVEYGLQIATLTDMRSGREYKDVDFLHNHYDSTADIVAEDLSGEPAAERFAQYLHNHSYRSDDHKWWGVVSGGVDTVKRLLVEGWQEGAVKAEEAVADIQLPQVKGVRRRRVRAAFGDSIDIHRVYTGGLDRAWDTTEREQHSNIGMNNVSIVVEIAAHCGITASEAFWRGALATMLAKVLSESGRNVEVLAVCTIHGGFTQSHSRDPVAMTTFQVKDFTMPLDVGQLMASTSAGAFRFLSFKGHCGFHRQVARNFGYPSSYKCDNAIPPAIMEHTHKVIYVPGDILSKEAARAFAANVIQSNFQ